MSFSDAAFVILKRAGRPLDCKTIVDIALKEGLVQTKGRTPVATLGAIMYMEIKRKGLKARFIKAGRGTFTINPDYDPEAIPKKPAPKKNLPWRPPTGSKNKTDNVSHLLHHLKHNLSKDGRQLEQIIKALFEKMGAEDVNTTKISNDGGIDLTATMKDPTYGDRDTFVIQVKNYASIKISAGEIRNLRGGASINDNCWYITTTDFSSSAKEEARGSGSKRKVRITNGITLSRLLIENNIGIKHVYPLDD